VTLEEEKNKALSRRLLKALFANGDLDTLDEVLAPDFVDHSLLPGQGSSTARCNDSEPMRTWPHDERLLGRSQKTDSLLGIRRYVQGPSGPHLLR
jgi:ketosteroid isomerase-like protein